MTTFRRILFLISLSTATSAFATSAMEGPNRTRPMPDSMAAQHRLQVRKTSQWLRDENAPTEEIQIQREKVLATKRKALIKELEKSLKAKKPMDPLNRSLRLGKLYLEEYYAALNAAHDRFAAALAKYRANPKKRREPKLNTFSATVNLNKARNLYRSLSQKYPKTPRRDEILYFYALTSVDKGFEKAAMDSFRQLVEKYPRSRFTPDALAQLGDHHFTKHEMGKAESYFDRIVKRNFKDLVPYAMYKKAWCAYNQQRPQEALRLLEWVIAHDKVGAGDLSLRVRNEALGDIVLLFTELNMVTRSISFFRGFDDTIYRRGLETMAGLYVEKGKQDYAIRLWEDLLDNQPKHPSNPTYEVRVVESLVLKADNGAAVARMLKRSPLYLEDGKWWDANEKDKEATSGSVTLWEELFRRQGTRLHDLGQKTQNKGLYAYARDLYTGYLERFSTHAEAPRVRFNLAKVLFQQGKLVESAEQYAKVFETAQDKELKKDGIVQALAALSQELSQNSGSGVLPRGKGKDKLDGDDVGELVEYSRPEEMFLDLSKTYLSSYPQAADVADVQYERAYLMYRHRDLDRAMPIFQKVVADFPGHTTAPSAGHLILDIWNRRKDYPALVKAAESLIDLATADKKFRPEVEDILRRAELKIVEGWQEEKRFVEAAEGYLRYCSKYGFQDDSLHERAMYNASANFISAGRHDSAADVMERYLRAFPKSPRFTATRLQLAETYGGLGQLERGARHYQEFVKANPKHKQSGPALQMAGWFFWGAGEAGRAEKVMESYLDAYPSDPAGEKALLGFYESQWMEGRIARYHRRILKEKTPGPVESVDRLLKVAELRATEAPKEAAALVREAREVAEAHPSALKKQPRGVEALAKLALSESRENEGRFFGVRLNKVSTLEANLKKKMDALKDLEKDYGRVVALGSEHYGLAAIYKTAAAYAHMAQEAQSAPVPSSLSGEALEAYQKELKGVMINPFIEKASNLVSQCLEQSQELHIFSSWTGRCHALGVELNPEKYANLRTFYLPALHTAVLMPDEEKSKIALGSEDEAGRSDFSSPLLFASSLNGATRSRDSLWFGAPLEQEVDSAFGAGPFPFEYGFLAEARAKWVERKVAGEAPAAGKQPTFAYLNLLRLKQPTAAVDQIKEVLKLDPENAALHNLLALAYLDSGNLAAAEVTWLWLLGKGQRHPAVLNNLGVLYQVRGRQPEAVAHWQEASSQENAFEAWLNLGYLSLQYRNGGASKEYFQEARQIRKNAASEVGFAVAQMQSGDLDDMRGDLEDLTKDYRNDPYARVAVAYYLMDVEKDYALARKVLTEYLEDNDLKDVGGQLQRALREATNGASEDVALMTHP